MTVTTAFIWLSIRSWCWQCRIGLTSVKENKEMLYLSAYYDHPAVTTNISRRDIQKIASDKYLAAIREHKILERLCEDKMLMNDNQYVYRLRE